MVHVCVVPGCFNRSNREKHLTFHSLPLKNKKLLQAWVHKIGRKNLPLNKESRVCSEHFVHSTGRRLRTDECPTIGLPAITTPVSKRKEPLERPSSFASQSNRRKKVTVAIQTEQIATCSTSDVGCQTDGRSSQELLAEIVELKKKVEESKFRLENFKHDDKQVLFYTGFQSYSSLMACYNYLGPSVNCLEYWGSKRTDTTQDDKRPGGRYRSLPPLEEFFLVLVRLRLGLFERDLAERFGVSTSTVSRIFITWINFVYIRFKEINLWPPKSIVQSFMPRAFKDLYPTTRVIIDATEIFIETPSLPELQQMTFSSYKNHNTYKCLIGISPGGAVTFVSKLFPGSITDKKLTQKSGLLDLVERGDSIMADRGFDIQDDLTPLGVKINIPPFMRGKKQLDSAEMMETRRIASLRIHVEREMERIKNYHIFDRVIPATLTNVAEQIFFVCAVLTNFLPPLCS